MVTVTEVDVELVLSFLNTVEYREGSETSSDTLDTEHGWLGWAAHRGLPGAGGQHELARQVRDRLRAAIGGAERAEQLPTVTGIGVVLTDRAPSLVAGDAVAEILVAASRLAVLGLWERVKICPADDCRWAFYDRSRNHSRTWCSMRICGNREKARNWRERAKPGV